MIHVLDPSAPPTAEPIRPASRPAGLAGKRIALIDNHKYGADFYLDAVERHLEDAGATVALRYQKVTPGTTLPSGVMKDLLQCDAVISGIADCGSNTSWIFQDSVTIEKAGIPTVTVTTDCFVAAGQAVAQNLGMAHLPVVEIPHPIYNRSKTDLETLAEQTFEELVSVLTGADASEPELLRTPVGSRS